MKEAQNPAIDALRVQQIIGFHASTYPYELSEIAAFSHFGDLRAAAKRLHNLITSEKSKFSSAWFYEAEFGLQSALDVPDGLGLGVAPLLGHLENALLADGNPLAKRVRDVLREYLSSSRNFRRRNLLWEARNVSLPIEEIADRHRQVQDIQRPEIEALTAFMAECGPSWDGFRYQNKVEGGVSYAPGFSVRPRRARRIGLMSGDTAEAIATRVYEVFALPPEIIP